MAKGKTIVFHNTKGGTLKTTLCVNVAGVLSRQGKKVLIVDLDPQGNSLQSFNINSNKLKESIYDIFFEGALLEDVILNVHKNIDFIPSNKDMRAIDVVIGQKNPTKTLKELITPLKEIYDYILIDTTPSLSYTTLIALYEADNVVVPFIADSYGFKGITDVTEELEIIKKKNKNLKEITLIMTKWVSNSSNQNEMYDQLANHYKNIEGTNLHKEKIKRSVIFPNSIMNNALPTTLVMSKKAKILSPIYSLTKELTK